LYCGVPGDPRLASIDSILYVHQGKVVMFPLVEVPSHFTEVFSNLENAAEVQEYAQLYVDILYVDLDSALKHSFFDSTSSEDFEKDCPILRDIPALTSTVSEECNGFVYQGLTIEPEGSAALYYFKYTITSDGKVIQDKKSVLSICQTMGIIY